MRRHTVTFQALEEHFHIGGVRSIDVDHERRRITVIADENDDEVHQHQEGATVQDGFNFLSERNS